MSADKKSAGRALISFIRSFTDLQEKHLKAIHLTMRETVDGVMQGIHEISDRTAQNKKKANEVLISTYTSPDAESKRAMDDVQDEVDRVLAAAQSEAAGPQSAMGSEILADKVRRTAGLFSKHMEALETLDGEVQELLVSMMGQLSRDDIITQRIEHIMMALQSLQTSLTYILTDFDNRCRDGEVERFINDLKTYMLRSYTMEEEKQAFFEAFPEEKARKAS